MRAEEFQRCDIQVMRNRVLYGLFDLGRLMVDNDEQYKVFRSEIERICNQAQDTSLRVIDRNLNLAKEQGNLEEVKQYVVRCYFGVYGGNFNSTEILSYLVMEDAVLNLNQELGQLMTLMFGTSYDHPKAQVFMSRAQKLVDDTFAQLFVHDGSTDPLFK